MDIYKLLSVTKVIWLFEMEEEGLGQPVSKLPVSTHDIVRNWAAMKDTSMALRSALPTLIKIQKDIDEIYGLLLVYSEAFPYFQIDTELAKALGPGVQKNRDIYEAQDLKNELRSSCFALLQCIEIFGAEFERTIYTIHQLTSTCDLMDQMKRQVLEDDGSPHHDPETQVHLIRVKEFIEMSIFCERNFRTLISHGNLLSTKCHCVLQNFQRTNSLIFKFAFDRSSPASAEQHITVVDGDQILETKHRQFQEIHNEIHNILQWVQRWHGVFGQVHANSQAMNAVFRLVNPEDLLSGRHPR